MKLGKLAPKRSLKTLALGNFLSQPSLPLPPTFEGWEKNFTGDWQMFANDTVGDCTCAAVGHMLMNWAFNTQEVGVAPTDAQILAAYSAITGYTPTDPGTDTGAAELDVLNYWKSTGIAGHKILGYATLDVQNIDQIKAACYYFGGVYMGFQVPQSAMQSRNWNQIGGPIEGGHAVPILGYGRAGCTCISWGQTYPMTWEFWQNYVDEAYAIVSPDWVAANGKSPVGLDMNALLSDLQEV